MSFFKNLIGKIFGGEEKNKSPQGLLDYGDTLKHADVDYKFAQLFTLSGGVFNYCVNEAIKTRAIPKSSWILKIK